MVDIFSPIALGPFELKNRLAFAPMDTHFGSPDGYITQQLIDHYVARCRDVGLATIEVNFISDRAKVWHAEEGGVLDIGDDSHIPTLADLCRAMKQVGRDIKVSVQMCHVGRYSPGVGLAPSNVPPLTNPQAKLDEMTKEDIKNVIEEFTKAAVRVKIAGYDAVTLHATHGFIPQQFMSPLTNKRTDEYGKDRLLFAKELIHSMKKAMGKEMALIIRLSCDEFIKKEFGLEALTNEDYVKIAPQLVEAGVDALDISAATIDTFWWTTPPGYFPKAFMMPYTKEIKSAVKVPVLGVGRINTPEFVQKVLDDGCCDIVSLARALFVDPDFVEKMRQGRTDDIRKCIACNFCIKTAFTRSHVKCAINASMGKDREYQIRPKAMDRRKKVMVIGGGPAGMEAAFTLRLRGHEVSLYEKMDELGGQLRIAVIPPGKEELNRLIEFHSAQLKKTGVKVFLNTEVTEELILRASPDAIVVAAGVLPFIPQIKGIDNPNVCLAEDVLRDKARLGERIVIIGGELVACEVAHYLTEVKGKKVTVVDLQAELATKMEPFTKLLLFRGLEKHKVVLKPGIQRYEEITTKGIRLINKEGKEEFLEADNIIIAAGSVSNTKVIEMAQGKTKEQLYIIGDSFEPRDIKAAVHDGARVGRQI